MNGSITFRVVIIVVFINPIKQDSWSNLIHLVDNISLVTGSRDLRADLIISINLSSFYLLTEIAKIIGNYSPSYNFWLDSKIDRIMQAVEFGSLESAGVDTWSDIYYENRVLALSAKLDWSKFFVATDRTPVKMMILSDH